MKKVLDITPAENNARNSEGSFIRLDDGRIMFAYSRYSTNCPYDDANCDIAVIFSSDEGESWTEPEIIVKAEEFGTKNVMSTSAIYQNDGRIGIYFLIKENNGTTTIGRTLTKDGENFETERCRLKAISACYVINNDRFIRLSDGRIAAPAASLPWEDGKGYGDLCVTSLFVSSDDGLTFNPTKPCLTIPYVRNEPSVDLLGGMQEPGVIEFKDKTLWLWARTRMGFQYESFSRDFGETFTYPQPSQFTSPCSPMEVARNPENDDLYAVYNPVPNYNGREIKEGTCGRTPFVIRKSTDDGRTWGELTEIENDEKMGYCYPAMFFTKDKSVLVGYCCGGAEEGFCLHRLRIMKINLNEIK